MKTRNYIIAALFAITFFASCTPESIQNDQAPQQIEKADIIVPPAG